MQGLVEYSDSDDSDNDSTLKKKRKLCSITKPPPNISNMFSKTPLKLTKRLKVQKAHQQPKDTTGLTETSFIYFPVLLDQEQCISDIRKVLEKIGCYVHSLNMDITPINLLHNTLTLSNNELHISITQNFNTTRANIDTLINDMRSNEALKAIKFPIMINFEPNVHFLPDKSSTKYFAVLKLSSKSIEAIKPFVEFSNCHKFVTSQPYDINFLHVSLTEITTNSRKVAFPTIEIPSIPSISLQSLCITKGRSIIPLFSTDPRLSSTDAGEPISHLR